MAWLPFARRISDPRYVRLSRKLAEQIDGIDLSGHDVGDVLCLSPHDAALLIAEAWAEPFVPQEGAESADWVPPGTELRRRSSLQRSSAAIAAYRPRRASDPEEPKGSGS